MRYAGEYDEASGCVGAGAVMKGRILNDFDAAECRKMTVVPAVSEPLRREPRNRRSAVRASDCPLADGAVPCLISVYRIFIPARSSCHQIQP
jgi:hypothetical protein